MGIATFSPAVERLNRRHSDPHRHVDWALVTCTLLLAVFGLVNVYAVRKQALVAAGESPYYFVTRQAIAVALGVVVMAVMAVVDYRRLRELALLGYLGTCALLVGVLLVGRTTNGAQAWFQLGPFQLQPSELAKVTLVLALAAYCSLSRGELRLRELITALVIAGVPMGLTLLQPDLGTAMVLGVITMGILLVAGARLKHIVVCSLIGLVAVVGILSTDTLKDYQRDRLTSFLTQEGDAAYNVEQSMNAVANGRLLGEGFLNGSQTNGRFVPEQHTDFIFSAAAEQFGFVGAGLMLAVYGVLALRIWRTAQLAKDLLGALICAGAFSCLAFHVFENVGMAMGIMPVTGIPLPMMSYGGSATITFMALMGLVLNVHMRRFS